MQFQGKTAIVTGAGKGIGWAIAQAFAQAGANVVIAEIDPRSGRAAADRLGDAALFVQTDVADEPAVAAMVARASERFGRIDYLVNNAATAKRSPVAELSLEDWNRVLGVNLTGPLLTAKHAAGPLRQAGGCIVNIASTRALMSEADTEAYSASKGGLVALSHALAISLGPAVRVHCISPGWIDTRAASPTPSQAPPLSGEDHSQHPAGRVGEPQDIAAMVLYLCSPAAAFITAQNFVIDGGMTRKMIYAE